MFPTLYGETKHLRYDPPSKHIIKETEFSTYISRIAEGITVLRGQAAKQKKSASENEGITV